MGIPWPPPDFLRGDDCLACYPAGETPKLLYATVEGVSDCGNYPGVLCDPNGIWTLTQSPVIPCQWASGSGLFRALYQASTGGISKFRIVEAYFEIKCFYSEGALCATSFTNQTDCNDFADTEGEGGTAVITPAPFPYAADAVLAAASLGLTDEDIYKWEVYTIEGSDDIVFRFVRPSRRDCIYIRWTPS